MLLLERIEFIGKLSNEKQLAFAILCAERSYQELYKVFPKFLSKQTKFRQVLDELWKTLSVKYEQLINWKQWFDEIHENFESKSYLIDFGILELARAINFSLSMMIWGRENNKLSSGCAEKTGEIFSYIYEAEDNIKSSIIIYDAEISWLTKALHLIANHELPKNYKWFLEQIPDYERGKIFKSFEDIE